MSAAFEELLARDGYLVYKTHGVSMEPMLRQNRDLVTIRVPASRLKKYDVALYKRGEAYVLHRVIGVAADHYLIRGDNTYAVERVPDSAVIGVLSSFKRKGREHSVTEPGYRLYARLWHAAYPLRALFVRCRRLAVRAARKTGLLPVIKKLLGRV
ncbi:MAG: S24/S26 family peptidase [Clostridia bacterium]|nr:S24/S26 family peptidase [Clostridia bacterium]